MTKPKTPAAPKPTSPPNTARVKKAGKGVAPLRFLDSGEIEYDHRDPATDTVETHYLDAPTIGHLRRIFEVDSKHQFPTDLADAEAADYWDLTVRFLHDAFAIMGTEIPIDDWPHWAASNDIRRAVMDHWLTVPFALPPSRRRLQAEATPEPTPETETMPVPSEPAFD